MGLPSPTVVEVSEHPDQYACSRCNHPAPALFNLSSRQIATFFLGWAFVTSLQCLLSSGVHSDVRRRFCGTRALNTDSEKASAYETMSNITIRSVHPSFMFVLSLCFMFASIAYFASLLSFDSGGVTVCGTDVLRRFLRVYSADFQPSSSRGAACPLNLAVSWRSPSY